MRSTTSIFDWLLSSPAHILIVNAVGLLLYILVAYRKQLRFIFKSLGRNLRRSILTSVAIIVLVMVVTLIWSVLSFLDMVTAERSQDLKAIVTERWQLPSQMPMAYRQSLVEGARTRPDDVKPSDYMTWTFYGGTIDPLAKTRDAFIFFFAMEPEKVPTMLDGLSKDELTPSELEDLNRMVKAMLDDKRKCIMGKDRLKALKKEVGERITVTSLNFKDINLEFEIIGVIPGTRQDMTAVMNLQYLNDAIDGYNREATKKGQAKHVMSEKSLNLVWLKVPTMEQFRRLADQVMSSSLYTSPAVKCETASSGIASFLDAYRDLLWGMRWLLAPAILATMALVIANAISISVRERRTEMAVLKVLGYQPGHIMGLVLGEALVVGIGSGLLSAGLAWHMVNNVMGGVKFPIAFFPAFRIPLDALWWGPAVGGFTALIGSIIPAWSARSVKVSEVFSKIS